MPPTCGCRAPDHLQPWSAGREYISVSCRRFLKASRRSVCGRRTDLAASRAIVVTKDRRRPGVRDEIRGDRHRTGGQLGCRLPDRGLPAARAKALRMSMSDQFATLCRGVELAPAQPEDLVGDTDAACGNRVLLRHYCVHLQGPDRQADLPTLRADVRAAGGFNGDIARHLGHWRAVVSDADQTAAMLGRRILAGRCSRQPASSACTTPRGPLTGKAPLSVGQ